jgi:hypothetical protein
MTALGRALLRSSSLAMLSWGWLPVVWRTE